MLLLIGTAVCATGLLLCGLLACESRRDILLWGTGALAGAAILFLFLQVSLAAASTVPSIQDRLPPVHQSYDFKEA